MGDNRTSDMEVIRENCKQSLQKAGVHESLCEFYTSAMQYEYDVNCMTSTLKQRLQTNAANCYDPQHLFHTMQDIIKCYAVWKQKIDAILSQSSSGNLPQLTFKGIKTHDKVAALCSIETDKLNIKAGEMLMITDNSHPDQLMVKTTDGKQGAIPTLCCLLPVPDKSPKSTAERLSIQLLVSWTETVRKAKPLIVMCVSDCVQNLYNEWVDVHSTGDKDRITRRLRRIKDVILGADKLNLSSLHNALFSVENEMNEWMLSQRMENLLRLKSVISNLDKTVLCYQTFRKQWHVFRKMLRSSHTPIRLVNSIAALRANRQNAIVKYYELKLTVTRSSYRDERVHITRSGVIGFTTSTMTADVRDGLTGQTVTVDQIQQIESEEQCKYVIDYVLNPKNGQRMSFAEAMGSGVIDIKAGVYRCDGGDALKGGGDGSGGGGGGSGGGDDCIDGASDGGDGDGGGGGSEGGGSGAGDGSRGGRVTGAYGLGDISYSEEEEVETTSKECTDENCEEDKSSIRAIDDNSMKQNTKKDVLSIREAMGRGAISVARLSSSGERRVTTSSVGVVVARTDTRGFTMVAIRDASTGEAVDCREAVVRGLLSQDASEYTVNTTGEKMHVRAAIARGWIRAIFEDSSDQYTDSEYAISHVVDQRRRVLVNFKDALMKQLFNIRTGLYTNNVTGDKISVLQAIKEGFIKAEKIKPNQNHSLMKYKECIETNL